ncbi:DUF116 domain-containing protein [Methanolapillus ohkumae]|uniref:DUF116 domain-containing protein n=1 Tax=Methanolapillus ohkumae TaxID=3028298 RepID=A0AA96ZVU5_9EURY|nr:hypothetical protein MsAm2_10670 [Methanosarcinaceae archaeon Am2]
MEFNYETIGRLAIILLSFLIIFNVSAILIGVYNIRRKKILFPKFVLFFLYFFYAPLKYIFSVFSMNEKLVDEILVEIQNAVSLDKFKKKNDRKILLLPQCLRDSNCRARCDPLYGFVCTECGRCDVGKICSEAKSRGFKVFVIPGGSFVKKIFTEYKPTSCIGVACPMELSESLQKASVIPAQGVYLINDGCFETKVNIDDIIQKMDLAGFDSLFDSHSDSRPGHSVPSSASSSVSPSTSSSVSPSTSSSVSPSASSSVSPSVSPSTSSSVSSSISRPNQLSVISRGGGKNVL